MDGLRYIDIKKLFNKLDLCRALPTFHVFTDSDYAVVFSRKGKSFIKDTLEE